MAGISRDQAILLITAAKNHGDLAVKLSSLKQAKEILLSLDSSLAGELFPYVADLQSSPESLVRKCLVELVEELGLKVMDQSSTLVPVLLTLLKDDDSVVVRQSIVCGTNFFCHIMEELAVQFYQSGKIERWLEELWQWMLKFKDAVYNIIFEPGPVVTKLLALKFLELHVLLFTSDGTDSDAPFREGKGRNFNISWLVGRHPILDQGVLASEVNKGLGLLLDILHAPNTTNTLRGSLIIAIINCLAAIARRRPVHYSSILSTLLGFDPNFETRQGGHAASIQYSLRTAFLGFLRSTHPVLLESRDRLLRALRAMNAGDAGDQAIRQVDKMLKNTERVSRDVRFSKDYEGPMNIEDMPTKRIKYNSPVNSQVASLGSDMVQDNVAANGASSKLSLLDSDLTPVEQMIAMIGALLAEGERGAESLEILISQIHPDLLADIVIANMKHLPKSPPTLSSRVGNLPVISQAFSSDTAPQLMPPTTATISLQPTESLQVPSPMSSATGVSISTTDVPEILNLPADMKRDPRRDPRRLDPRRVVGPVGVQSASLKLEDVTDIQSGLDDLSSMNRPLSLNVATKVEHFSVSLTSRSDIEPVESRFASLFDTQTSIENEGNFDEAQEIGPVQDVPTAADLALSPVDVFVQDQVVSTLSDITDSEGVDESDQYSSASSSTSPSEDNSTDFPLLPPYVELKDETSQSLSKLAIGRIMEAYSEIQATDYSQARLALLARLVAQMDADDDFVVMLQKHIISDYQHQKGHELAMHVLYHLYNVMISESEGPNSSFAATNYEKFLLAMAKSLLHSLPASDKSFSRLLGEVPLLPDSALKLLEDLCHSDGFDTREGDRVTQGLGAVWSLILGRPPNRQACLSIALKCTVHSHDDIRAKAIRLVANKLYLLSYISENIEQFAKDMLLAVVDQRVPDAEQTQTANEQRTEANVAFQETSVSGSQNSEPGASESDSTKGAQSGLQSVLTVSLSQAHRRMSLFFALCTKNPSLLQLIFDIYGRAPKAVKQAIHRHMPILIRSLGSSYSELLRIISDPPVGCENLLMLVLQILTEETTPPPDLIATVKHLYDTKLKDAAILIPMLSLLSKEEVLPIFPRLVDLPLEKFQTALARILQGSAHTGPALTPAEVLVAIHDIIPERHGIALKKITDACSACFEQRTVFTQQVLAKALNQMVEQTPLPLLLMRTVIQAIDAFPTLVDFVMEILSKLVDKQIWKMPKLWVGFLKCASQTQPHSFRVLLQLPPPQLEGALNKHSNLRSALAAHASQPSIRTSLPRSTQVVLGLLNESQTPRSHLPAALHTPDASSSIHGATPT